MKTPTKIEWTGTRLGFQGEAWTAKDEHGQTMGTVERWDQGNVWVWHAFPAFATGETRRRRGAMYECERAILRDWPANQAVAKALPKE